VTVVRDLSRGDDDLVATASHLLDAPAGPEATADFLPDGRHHLLVVENWTF
jgi:hypothetical protein